MNENKEASNQNESYESSSKYFDEFDFIEFLKYIWLDRTIIIAVTSLFAFTSIIYALFLPNIYSSEALLTTVDDADAGGGISSLVSRYGGLASAAGVSLPSAGGGKADLVVATITSREFFKHLTTFDFVLPGLMASKSYNTGSQKLLFDQKSYNSEKNIWIDGSPSYLEAYKQYLRSLEVGQDKRTNFIFLIFHHISPEFSYQFIDLIVNEVNNKIRTRHFKESTIALDYLKNELASTAQREVQQSISQLIEAQLKIQMLANIRKDYIIRAIDPGFLPEEKSAPRKTRMVILATIIGLILSIFVSIIRQTYFIYKPEKNS
jgi:capsular polysaccharide biosynthesis protein